MERYPINQMDLDSLLDEALKDLLESEEDSAYLTGSMEAGLTAVLSSVLSERLRSSFKRVMTYVFKLGSKEWLNLIIPAVIPYLDERQRRLFLGAVANALGRGGIALVSEISGITRQTVATGIKELLNDYSVGEAHSGRVRKEGGGRKPATETYPDLEKDIKEILDKSTYGTPTKDRRWTALSLRKVVDILTSDYGITVDKSVVAKVMDDLKYGRMKNQKNLQVGEPNPHRDEQFTFINDKIDEFIAEGQPVISIDTKKKELVGNFLNKGTKYCPKGQPVQTLDHDFALPELGKAIPYGIYVVNNNTGFVNLGTDHDTAEFAGESILRWWGSVGKATFPNATKLYITSDCGGSNNVRTHLWKYVLQLIANATGLEIHVSHYPPGTSKWNKVEHCLFCYISKNWQGEPLTDIETIVRFISNTTTKTGLTVICQDDQNKYELKKEVPDEEMKKINIERIEPFGNWNYILRPQSSQSN